MSTNLEFKLATAETEGHFRKLLRENALSGNINLLLTREPNAFHAAGVSGDVFDLVLAYRQSPSELIGAGARFEFDAFVNGETARVGYLGELRVHGGFRQRRTLLLEAYRNMRRYHQAGKAPYYITTIISDNRSTRRLLEAGLSDMPTYRPVEEMVTLTIPARRAARARVSPIAVESGADNDIDAIADRLQRTGRAFQFHPVWDSDTLRSTQRCRGISPADFCIARADGEIRGVLCLWDQRAFKQSVVAGYSRRLSRLRPFVNMAAPLLRQPRLPTPGNRLESAFLSHLSVDDDETLIALVRHAAERAVRRGIDYVMLGLAARNDLTHVIQRKFSCHRYMSMIYLVYWPDGCSAAVAADDRIPHPEMAIL